MKAVELVKRRIVLREDLFAEIVVWRVPMPVRGGGHDLKYRLAIVRSGVCVVRFDNEAGKGDHMHRGLLEERYVFRSLDTLLDDFFRELEVWADDDPKRPR